MKKLTLFLMLGLISAVSLSLTSCGKDDPKPGNEINALLLAALEEVEGTWLQTSITQNGDEPQYEITTSPQVVIAVDKENGTENSITITNGHYVLPDMNITWSFVENTNFLSVDLTDFTVTRSNSGNTMTLTRIADEELTDGGRVESIGTYAMTFTKQ